MKNRRGQITVDDTTLEYFTVCARIRNLHRPALLRRLLTVIANDALVSGILDDEDHLRKRRPSEWKFKEPTSPEL